jgi:hypothetical protein
VQIKVVFPSPKNGFRDYGSTVRESWKNMKTLCKYKGDTAFAKHLLSLELKRQNKYVDDQICIWFLKLFCIIQQNVNRYLNIRLHFKISKSTRTKGKEKQRAAKSKPKAMIEEIDVNMDSEQRKSYLYCST